MRIHQIRAKCHGAKVPVQRGTGTSYDNWQQQCENTFGSIKVSGKDFQGLLFYGYILFEFRVDMAGTFCESVQLGQLVNLLSFWVVQYENPLSTQGHDNVGHIVRLPLTVITQVSLRSMPIPSRLHLSFGSLGASEDPGCGTEW